MTGGDSASVFQHTGRVGLGCLWPLAWLAMTGLIAAAVVGFFAHQFHEDAGALPWDVVLTEVPMNHGFVMMGVFAVFCGFGAGTITALISHFAASRRSVRLFLPIGCGAAAAICSPPLLFVGVLAFLWYSLSLHPLPW